MISLQIFALFCSFTLSKQWILGYDQLMNPSTANHQWEPVRVQGFIRAWDVKGSYVKGESLINSNYQQSAVFLGAVGSVPENSINAVAFQIAPAELTALDQKIGTNFNRNSVPLAQIQTLYGLKSSIGAGDEAFIYQLKPAYQLIVPGDNTKISQSLVDLVINACLAVDQKYATEIGAGVSFSNEFMNTTSGWNTSAWVNDRVLPRRPSIYQPNAAAIDAVLKNQLGQAALDMIQLDIGNTPTVDLAPLTQRVNDTETGILMLAYLVSNITHNQTILNDQNQIKHAQIDASISTLNANISTLNANISTLNNQLVNVTSDIVTVKAQVATNTVNIDVNHKSFLDQIAALKLSYDAQMTEIRKEIAELQGRLKETEQSAHTNMIGWIVSVVIFAFMFACIGFFLWRQRSEQGGEGMESVPLRPARGYSYT